MSTKKAHLLFIVLTCVFASLPSNLKAVVQYTFTCEDDPHNQVVINDPSNWSEVEAEEGEDRIYDLKLRDATNRHQCTIFFYPQQRKRIPSEDLLDASNELKSLLFPAAKTHHHLISTQRMLCWQTFDVEKEQDSLYVGIAVFQLENYLFGVVVENDQSREALVTDVNLFIQNISVIAKNPASK